MTTEQFERLIANSQPHLVFKQDWSFYSTLDFANTFLPKAPEYDGKAFHFFDGAELLIDADGVVRNTMQLNKSKDLTTVLFYTYPKGVEAGKKKDRIRVEEFSVATFVEVSQDEKIEISFRFGKELDDFIKKYARDNKIAIDTSSLQKRVYLSTVAQFKQHFGGVVSHYNMLKFIGTTIGIDFAKIHNESALMIRIYKVSAETSSPVQNIQKIHPTQPKKYVIIDFEILNQPVVSCDLFIYEGRKEIDKISYLPEVSISGKSDNIIVNETPVHQPGQHRIIWDCTDNGLFETKDTSKKILIKIICANSYGQKVTIQREVFVKQMIDAATANDFILIVDPKKQEGEEDCYIQIYADTIIERQKSFIGKIPQNIYDALTEEEKLILNLPIIMTKLGFLYGALCQIHWLEGSGKSLKFPYQFFMSEKRVEDIDRKNLEEYFKHLLYLSIENLGYTPTNPDGENRFLFNEKIDTVIKSLQLFNANLSERTEGGEIGDFENLATERHEQVITKDNYFQSFSEGSATGDLDDIGVALGRYSQRCYFKGDMWKNESTDKWILSTKEVGCRFFDDFSFGDKYLLGLRSQDLGCWINDIDNPGLPTKSAILSNKRVCLQNIDFIGIREKLQSAMPNSCSDFFIYSDIKILDNEFLQKDIIIF